MRKATSLCFAIVVSVSHCFSQNKNTTIKTDFKEVIWHVKGFKPDEVKFLKIKAIDKAGNIYDVKAIQN